MAFKYEEAVPWGRNFGEYRRMFALTEDDLAKKILGCGDGPASFNAAMFRAGNPIRSCDPLYQFSAEQIQARIDATYETVISQTKRNQEKFIWQSIKDPDELGKIRMNAMQEFLADYELGKTQGRYITAELPDLPFKDGEFDLAICSHFLFLYSDNFSLEFHEKSLETLCRIANDVRIFPILDYNAEVSLYLAPLQEKFKQLGYQVALETVNYEFQRGGNQMLRIVKA